MRVDAVRTVVVRDGQLGERCELGGQTTGPLAQHSDHLLQLLLSLLPCGAAISRIFHFLC